MKTKCNATTYYLLTEDSCDLRICALKNPDEEAKRSLLCVPLQFPDLAVVDEVYYIFFLIKQLFRFEIDVIYLSLLFSFMSYLI